MISLTDIKVLFDYRGETHTTNGDVALELLNIIALDDFQPSQINGVPVAGEPLLDLDFSMQDTSRGFFDEVWARLAAAVYEYAPLDPDELTLALFDQNMTLAQASMTLSNLDHQLSNEDVDLALTLSISGENGTVELTATRDEFIDLRVKLVLAVTVLTRGALGEPSRNAPESATDAMRLFSDFYVAIENFTGDLKRAGKITISQRDQLRKSMKAQALEICMLTYASFDTGFQIPWETSWLTHELGPAMLINRWLDEVGSVEPGVQEDEVAALASGVSDVGKEEVPNTPAKKNHKSGKRLAKDRVQREIEEQTRVLEEATAAGDLERVAEAQGKIKEAQAKRAQINRQHRSKQPRQRETITWASSEPQSDADQDVTPTINPDEARVSISTENGPVTLDGKTAFRVMTMMLESGKSAHNIPTLEGSFLDLLCDSKEQVDQTFNFLFQATSEAIRTLAGVREGMPLSPRHIVLTRFGLTMTLSDAIRNVAHFDYVLSAEYTDDMDKLLVPVETMDGSRGIAGTPESLDAQENELMLLVACLTKAALGTQLRELPTEESGVRSLLDEVAVKAADIIAQGAGDQWPTEIIEDVQKVMHARLDYLLEKVLATQEGWPVPEQFLWLAYEFGSMLLVIWLLTSDANIETRWPTNMLLLQYEGGPKQWVSSLVNEALKDLDEEASDTPDQFLEWVHPEPITETTEQEERILGRVTQVHPEHQFCFVRDTKGTKAFLHFKDAPGINLKEGLPLSYVVRPGHKGPKARRVQECTPEEVRSLAPYSGTQDSPRQLGTLLWVDPEKKQGAVLGFDDISYFCYLPTGEELGLVKGTLVSFNALTTPKGPQAKGVRACTSSDLQKLEEQGYLTTTEGFLDINPKGFGLVKPALRKCAGSSGGNAVEEGV